MQHISSRNLMPNLPLRHPGRRSIYWSRTCAPPSPSPQRSLFVLVSSRLRSRLRSGLVQGAGWAGGKAWRTTMAADLPELPDVSVVCEAPRIVRVLGGNPSKFSLQGTNTYLVGPPHAPTLIDVAQGFHTWLAAIKPQLPPNAAIPRLLLTHWHPDHTLGLPDFLSLLAAKESQIHKAAPTYLGHGDNATQLKQLAADGKIKYPDWRDIADGQVFDLGDQGWTLRALRTPGHAHDHTCFLLEKDGAVKGMFTGDNVLGHGTAVFEDLALYMSSLHKMQSALPSPNEQTQTDHIPLYPAHGALILDGDAKMREYISHREMRERQILDTLRNENGGRGLTSMEIVKVVYKDYPESLWGPAEGGVRQVLVKLEGEGRVRRREEEGEEVWSLAGEGEGGKEGGGGAVRL